MNFLTTVFTFIVPFLLVLGLIITIHELGHFLTAKAFGVAIDRFSIGFGKAILSRTDRSGVEWRLGWIPLGGYVRFAGDENDASVPDQNDLAEMRARIVAAEGPGAELKYLPFKPLWQRALIVAAGPAANFVLAIVIFAFLSAAFGRPSTDPLVSSVRPGTPAARAGFLPGDRVLRADQTEIRRYEELQSYVTARAGAPIQFTIQRADRVIHLTATPERSRIQNGLRVEQYGGQLGLEARGGRYQRLGVVQSIGYGAQQTWGMVKTTFYVFGRLLTGQMAPRDVLGGPIQMASVSQAVVEASSVGPTWQIQALNISVNLLQLAALISVSIGIMNLLPIPVLDGGHLLFYAYEAVARRPLGAGVQMAGYRVGLALLLCLMLFATWNDLQRLRVFQSLGGLFS